MSMTESIDSRLLPAAEGAVAWLNQQQEVQFNLTGLVDSEAALAAIPGEPYELSLILCAGDLCQRKQVIVTPQTEGYTFDHVPERAAEIPALLDPPPGVRKAWLDTALSRHEFVLLLFYRGRW